MNQMDLRNDQLKEHAEATAEQYLALEQKVEPFKEQLESFELEKNALLSRNEASKEEVCFFSLFLVINLIAFYPSDEQARVRVLQSSRPSEPETEDKACCKDQRRKSCTEN